MKGFGRALELNFIFLLVVALLVALHLVLQRSQSESILSVRERGDEGEATAVEEENGGETQQQDPSPLADPLHLLPQKHLYSPHHGNHMIDPNNVAELIAAPVVPNIRRSFPKRKAPYVRKAKNKKKKKNRKGKKQQQKAGGGGGGMGKNNKRGKAKVSDKVSKTVR